MGAESLKVQGCGFGDGDLFEAESSGSEAEEVNGLEDEYEESGSVDHLTESSSELSPLLVKRRKAAFLSDSEPSFVEEQEDHSTAENVVETDHSLSLGQTNVTPEDIVISPSLLVSKNTGTCMQFCT